jgi:Spy/CpxP family protein refolding chaperone
MRTQKFSLMAALALGSLLACTSISSAQTTNAVPSRGRGSVQQRVDRMNSELNLTPDQKTKVTALFEDESKKRQELRNDTSIPREQKREKGQAMLAEQDNKLKEILTPDQYEKWQKIRQQFRPRRQEAQSTEKKTE